MYDAHNTIIKMSLCSNIIHPSVYENHDLYAISYSNTQK